MTALTTEAFRRQVQQMPGGVTAAIERLRRESARPEGVRADPLALPGGAAGERAWHDRQAALRRQLKTLLAGNKLHAGLVTAALSRPAVDGAPETPDGATNEGATSDGVTEYVERAGRWIEAVTAALARRWGVGAGAEDATDGAAGRAADGAADEATGEAAGGVGLSGHHRYELARTLVAALRELPELPERVDPERMAAHLAAPAPALPPEPSAPDRVSAGPRTDRALAWSRALATVLEAAADAPFERPLETVLADARAALTGAAADRVAALDAAFPVPAAARPIVEQHALQTSARLYAATLRHVHRESARMIARYRSLRESGLADEADLLARDYQDGHWGYAGVAHHFRALLAAHAAQQDAALAAMPAPETETAVEVTHKATSEVTPEVAQKAAPEAAEPDRPDPRALAVPEQPTGAVRAAGPVP